MTLDELRTLIIDSTRERDWHDVAVGTYFADVPLGNEGTYEWHESLIVYRHDVNLTIQWGMRSRLLSHVTKSADLWRANAVFPDPSAIPVHADIFWAGSLVDRVQLVFVDGARALLPVGDQRALNWNSADTLRPPKDVEWEYSATRFEVALARLLDNGHEFDSYFRRIGMVVKD